jgi:hypothetical protein
LRTTFLPITIPNKHPQNYWKNNNQVWGVLKPKKLKKKKKKKKTVIKSKDLKVLGIVSQKLCRNFTWPNRLIGILIFDVWTNATCLNECPKLFKSPPSGIDFNETNGQNHVKWWRIYTRTSMVSD